MKTRVLLLISGMQTLRQRVVPEIHKDISKRWKDQVIRKGTRIKQAFEINKMKFDRIKGRSREVYSITGDFITYPFLINWLLISSHPWLKDLFWALSWIFNHLFICTLWSRQLKVLLLLYITLLFNQFSLCMILESFLTLFCLLWIPANFNPHTFYLSVS